MGFSSYLESAIYTYIQKDYLGSYYDLCVGNLNQLYGKYQKHQEEQQVFNRRFFRFLTRGIPRAPAQRKQSGAKEKGIPSPHRLPLRQIWDSTLQNLYIRSVIRHCRWWYEDGAVLQQEHRPLERQAS